MSNCVDCDKFESGGNIYVHQAQQPFCEQCGGDNKCIEVLDSKCVVYHSDNREPTKLIHLQLPNGSSAEVIFEAIDDLLGSGFNTPIVKQDSESVILTSSGVAGHTLKADVKLSLEAGNTLQIKSDGLFTKSFDDGKVKVDTNDQADYLEDQIIGGTDGIVSNSVLKQDGQLQVQPSLDIEMLLNTIKNNPAYVQIICEIIAKCVCEAPSNVQAQIV